LAAGTIDEQVFALINSKRSVVDAATEGVAADEEKINAASLMKNFLPD
tara:strand:- start:672 stop:815 length:144 start_codon:yes stop_codon:yes gene_type:complete